MHLPHGRPRVFEKLDGSLGVVYREPTSRRWSVATRGSFDGEQARWATQRLRSDDRLTPLPREDRTYLLEVIYPANRVVVDYGDREDLVLLDVLALDDGRSVLDEELDRLDGVLPVAEELALDVEAVRARAVDPSVSWTPRTPWERGAGTSPAPCSATGGAASTPWVFSLLSGKDLHDQVAERLRPSPPVPFVRRREDEA